MIAVCLHGFLRSGFSMYFVEKELKKQGYKAVLSPSFALHTRTLDDHAKELSTLVQDACTKHQATRVDVVTYSMGGLLFRASLAHDIPYRRGVMIAPPNKGASLAQLIRTYLPLQNIGWDPLHQLLPDQPMLLPIPNNMDIGIIAGIKGDGKGYNAFLPEDNDGKVCVSETYLPMEVPHIIVQGRHPMLIIKPSVIAESVHFLAHGQFMERGATA